MIYIETPQDLRRLEQAAQDGRFHVSWFVPYAFRDISLTQNPVSTNTSTRDYQIIVDYWITVALIFISQF